MYRSMVPSSLHITNGFFQAYVNSDFLKQLCPVTHPLLLLQLFVFLFFLSVMAIASSLFIKHHLLATSSAYGFLMLIALGIHNNLPDEPVSLLIIIACGLLGCSLELRNRKKEDYQINMEQQLLKKYKKRGML